ncbi:MAG: hypothetical protein D6824_07065 [Planctomycetota bacterium]|nr:MAG: hypothetical protein D6824_07065 [Planctomycetota bacterium]
MDEPTADSVVAGKRLLVGVGGGVAAYKTCELVSRLAQRGASVVVLMTDAATRFVAPLTFEALSGQRPVVSLWEQTASHDPQHIRLAREADAAVVAPATMDLLARLACGLTSDPVTLTLSAVDRHRQPVLLAPAMNETMWRQPATQRAVAQLREDGFLLEGPEEGWQACRTVGVGRMAEPLRILASLERLLQR